MAIPLMAIQYFQQRESLNLIQDLNNHEEMDDLLQKQMHRLQELANINPVQEESYKKDFFNLLKLKKNMTEMGQVQNSLIRTLEKQSLKNAILVVLLSLVLSLAVSWNIVNHFKKLLLEKETSLIRKHELEQMEQWQNTARCLVHEIRAPLTPIKLITSAWEGMLTTELLPKELRSNEESLNKEKPALDLDQENAFTEYKNTPSENKAESLIPNEIMQEGLSVITEKLQLMENMINRFTVFAKLPAPNFKSIKLSDIIYHFIEQYRDNFKADLLFDITLIQDQPIMADEGLLHNSFYAIVKNAVEANPNSCLSIHFRLRKTESHHLSLSISNNGADIPEKIISSLFEFGVSSKLPGSHNFGIGLAMSKKIALEHNAEINLVSNKANEKISFEFLFKQERNP
jgi:signal transduction histidine kinase